MADLILPARDNAGDDCELRDDRVPGRDHIQRCTCSTHDGVCEGCGFKITIGPSGTEYGHARGRNRRNSDRADCHHRPTQVDPQGPGTRAPAGGGE